MILYLNQKCTLEANMWHIVFTMTSCLHYWRLRGKDIVCISQVFSLCFSRPIKSLLSQSKQFFFLVPTVFRIQFCLAFNSKNENGMLSLLWKALLNYTWHGWQCTFFGFALFCYTINRNYRNKNIYIFLSVSIH